VAWTTTLKQRVRPLVRDPIPDHARVFEAIALGDADTARTAMAELVELALFDTRTAPRLSGTVERDGAAA
jgi:DNA-binding FadR family transcriptional regulator